MAHDIRQPTADPPPPQNRYSRIVIEQATQLTQVTVVDALPSMFRAIDLLGVFLNGVIGGRLARQKGFDAVGFAVLAVMSALGGGIVRDVMLSTVPAAITDPYYLSTALVGALLALLLRFDSRWSVRAIIVADGLVLGAWAATGALKTLSFGHGIMPALLLGLTTAIGGGMIRDISAGNVPVVFGGNNLYALPGALAAGTMIACYYANLRLVGMLLATLIGGTFAILAHWRRWVLPRNQDWTITMTSAQLRTLLRRRGLHLRHPMNSKRVDVSAEELEQLQVTPDELRSLGMSEEQVSSVAADLQEEHIDEGVRAEDPLPIDSDPWPAATNAWEPSGNDWPPSDDPQREHRGS